MFYEYVFNKYIHICGQITISGKTGHEFEGDKEEYMENVERGNRREIRCNYIIIKNIKKHKTYLTNYLHIPIYNMHCHIDFII